MSLSSETLRAFLDKQKACHFLTFVLFLVISAHIEGSREKPGVSIVKFIDKFFWRKCPRMHL